MQEEIKDMGTVTIMSDGQICIPSVARDMVGFKEGMEVSVVVCGDRVELKPMKEKDNEVLMCMLASEDALAKNWLSEEDEEAWKDL